MDKALEDMLREVEALPEGQREWIVRVLATEVRRAKRETQAPRGALGAFG